jgi:hypothetical protein
VADLEVVHVIYADRERWDPSRADAPGAADRQG